MDLYEFKGRLVYSKLQSSQGSIVRSYLKRNKNNTFTHTHVGGGWGWQRLEVLLNCSTLFLGQGLSLASYVAARVLN